MWACASVYLIYLGVYLGLFHLIGALSRAHRFQDPHDSNDLQFDCFLKVPQLVHIWCFWFPFRGDRVTCGPQLGQLPYRGTRRMVYLPYVDAKMLFFA
jgi:hypothetical protein